MISGNFTISSNCSLASLAGDLEGTVISVYVYPLEKDLNYVFSIANATHLDGVEHLITKDFVSHKIYVEKEIIMIQGVKHGHGVMSSIIESGSIPIFPILARDGLEIFNFVSLSDRSSGKLQEFLEKRNDTEDFFYDKVRGNEFVSGVPKRWGILTSMNLTSTERNLIKTAYKHGFFEWPRTYDLELMRKDYNLSKPTLLYHLRNAERKIMKTIFD